MNEESRGTHLSLAVLLALLLLNAATPAQAVMQIADRNLEGYSFRDFTHLLPNGAARLDAATPQGDSTLLAGQTASGLAFLAEYDATGSLRSPWPSVPAHHARLTALVPHGTSFVVAGDSAGTSPILGRYDPGAAAVADLSGLLPPEVNALPLLVPGSGTTLAILENASGPQAFLLNPAAPSLQPHFMWGMENLTVVHDGVWNGSAFLLAGAWAGGQPALVAFRPGDGALTDLSDLLPNAMTRLDRLVWTGDLLYLAGRGSFVFPTRAMLALWDPSTGEVTDLTTGALREYQQITHGLWNGTAFLFLVRGIVNVAVGVHDPLDELSIMSNVIPPNWDYVAMAGRGQDVLLVANNVGPALGVLRPASWTWEDRTLALEGAFHLLVDATPFGESFALVGLRSTTPALGILRPDDGVMEDQSRELGLSAGAFWGVAWSGTRLLLTGENASSGILYAHDQVSGALTNLTPQIPSTVTTLYGPASNGTHVLVLGFDEAGAAALLVGPGDSVTDLGPALRQHLLEAWAAVPYDVGFLVLGIDRRGPAALSLDPATGSFTSLGDSLLRLYGDGAVVIDGSWNGEVILLGGLGGNGPLLGTWTPSTGFYRDLAPLLPEGLMGVQQVTWRDGGFFVAGIEEEGVALARYRPETDDMEDLTGLLPPSYGTVVSLASGPDGVVVVGLDQDFRPTLGLIVPAATGGGFFDVLLGFLQGPGLWAIVGLSVALAAILGFMLGRRGARLAGAHLQEEPYYVGYEGPERS